MTATGPRAGIGSERDLARLALLLGADEVAGWSGAEQRLAAAAAGRRPGLAAAAGKITGRIRAGGDPLGEAFCLLRTRARRRASGQTFTPAPVRDAMIGWAAAELGSAGPARVVEPGAGSARFLVAAGRRWPAASLTGVETDPLAALIARASLAAAGLAGRATVLLADYRSVRLPPAPGPTLFIGNPPYVRHHQIPAPWKDWYRSAAARHGLAASALAGLHAHFFLATAGLVRPGDAGVLVTAAEWLDVNYGSLVRGLLLGPLGGRAVHLLDPAVPAFADAAATSAIACFRPGSRPGPIWFRYVRQVADLAGLADVPCLAGPADLAGRPGPAERTGGRRLAGSVAVPVSTLRAARRWGPLARNAGPAGRGRPAGYVELGELCRVSRGQVTGANRVWVVASGGTPVPARYLFPAVTRARELLAAGAALTAAGPLRLVIDLPADLGELTAAERALVDRFLAAAATAGAADSYIARHRRPWWRVRLPEPAPILATYMARRPPAFVRNLAGARHLNIAHGLYPREPLPPAVLDRLAAHLRGSVTPGQGRTYAGGLTKFEPGEMERLPVPGPGLLTGEGRQIQW